MPARNKNNTGRRSWRETPAQVTNAPVAASKWPLRVLLALVMVLLIGCFAWLLWQPARPEPQTYFVALTTGRGDLLSVPPILFEKETLAPLRDLSDSHHDLRFIDGENSQRSAKTSNIESLLDRLEPEKDDRLIIYVSAHGVSEEGVAYVLGPGYDLRKTSEQRYSVNELLAVVSRIPLTTKLVVFDCSRLAVLPRMGMVLNEFSSLVQQAASECDDENLWVSIAAPELETSPLGLAQRRSVFGSALIEGIIGGADNNALCGNADRNVTLTELEDFIKQQCAVASVATPTPKFLFCGSQAASSRRKDPVLLRIYPEDPVEETEDANQEDSSSLDQASSSTQSKNPASSNKTTDKAPAPQESPTTEKESPPAEKDSSSESSLADAKEASPNAQPEEPQSAVTNNSPEKTPNEKSLVFSPILQAWQLRDQLQQEQQLQNLEPLPADYAPHYWNALNTALVDLHLQQIGHPRSHKVSSNIADYQQGLQQLIDPSNMGNSKRVTEEVGRALQRYSSSKNLEQLSSLPREYAYAILFLRRSIFRANQYVDWHRTAHASAGDAGSTHSEITNDLSQLIIKLSAMDQQLAKLESGSLESPGQMKILRKQQTNIRSLFGKLDRKIASPTASRQKQHTPGVQRQLENLLSTPLASADLRAAAISLAPAEKNTPRESQQPRWSTALSHLRLECLLMQLAAPKDPWSDTFRAIAGDRQRLPANDEEMRQLFRRVGNEIKDFYAQIPSRIEGVRSAREQLSDVRTAEKLIAILHPRDAADRSNDSLRVAGFVVPRLHPPARVTVQNPQQTTLRQGHWISIRWPLRLENLEVQSAVVTLGSYNQDRLDVRFAGNESHARPGQKKKLLLNTQNEIAVEVRLRGEPSDFSNRLLRVPLAIRLLSTDKKKYELTGEAKLRIPHPNPIDLIAWCVEPRILQQSRGEMGTRLQPFPNRTTVFHFALVNHSDEAKKLRLELFAVPRPRSDAWPPGLLLDKNDQPDTILQNLSKSKLFASPLAVAELNLPADGKPYPALLKKLGAGDEESDKPEASSDPKSEAEEPPAMPPVAQEITHGLVCRLVDSSGNSDDVIKWIEITTLRPSSYLQVRASYDDVSNELRFVASTRNLDGLPGPDMPPQSAEKPVIVNFFGDGQVLEAGGKGKAIISLADQKGEIFAKLTRTISGNHLIGLVVDGFPRSHQWEIDFDTGTIQPTPNYTSVKIDWIGMPGAGDKETGIAARLYRNRPRLAFPSVSKKIWPVLRENRNHLCAFDVSREARQLKLRLQVDAPRDAFNSVGGNDVLEIGWQGKQPLHRFYTDRAVRCTLVEITKQGDLAIATKVDDLEVSLNAAQTINTSRGLQTQLRLEGREADIDSRTIVFDDKPPEIITAGLNKSKLRIGTKYMRAVITVKDLSGTELVEAWVLPEHPAGEEELDPKAAKKYRASDSVLPGTYSEKLHRSSLRVSVPEKLGKYFLVLRVTDRSGQKITTLPTPIRFAVVAPPPPPKPGPVIHDLVGVVKLGSRPAPAGLKVTAKENPKLSATTASDGKFVIKRVKAGSYTLLVKGLVGSGLASGKLEVELAEKADYEIEILADYEIAGTPE